MATNQDKGYISKKIKGNSQYNSFYQEGIEVLQKLSGNVWTDYNLHDPGVTILENLAYTLTHLSYITNFPIVDILTSSKGTKLSSGDQGLFPPSEILTTNPVTLNDYRKIVIDQVTNVKNVWFKITENSSNDSNKVSTNSPIMGLYDVYIEVFDYYSDTTKMEEETERIKKGIRKCFFRSRNLGEDIHKIIIQDPIKLDIKIQIKLHDNIQGEDVLANVLYLVQNYLSPEVIFNSLQDLISSEVPVEEIFEGPALEYGFITEDSLKDKRILVSPKEIIKIISTLPQVINVDVFELYIQTEHLEILNSKTLISDEGVSLTPNKYWDLNFPTVKSQVKFEQRELLFDADLDEVQRQLYYLQTKNYGVFPTEISPNNLNDLPEGKKINLKGYYPIREQFPLVYGIGQFGLPKGLPSERYAQAKQLIAYLLPFDQLMLNYLSQLNNLFQLYNVNELKGKSIDDNPEIVSYFYGILEDMPNLTYLINSEDTNSEPSQKLAHWESTINSINKEMDNKSSERLNAIADHLLARYNEIYPAYALTKINYASFGKEVQPKLELDILNNKRKLLANYAHLSYNRNKAFSVDDIQSNSTFTALPAIIEKIAMIMNISDYSTRKLSSVITESGIKIYKNEKAIDSNSQDLETIIGSIDISANTFDSIYIVDENVESLTDSFYFLGNHQSVLKNILFEGVKRENYIIKPKSDYKKFFTLLSIPETRPYIIHISSTNLKAERDIQRNISFLNILNDKSEGIHSIEHLSLAPPYTSASFGFTFDWTYGGSSPISFIHSDKKDFQNRNEIVLIILDLMSIKKNNLEIIIVNVNHQFCFRICQENGDSLFQSINSFLTIEEAKNASNFFKDNMEQGLISKLNYTVYIGDVEINEDFFSFQVSSFMPSWPSRFQQPSFRKKFSDLLYEQAPAHILFNNYWIDLEDMIYFEEIYLNWLKIQNMALSFVEKSELSLLLIQFIQKNQR